MSQVDVAVVGAGPAGISAAIAAASTGASTLLIDENSEIGGQLRWRINLTIDKTAGLDVSPGAGPQVARDLAEKLTAFDNLAVKTGTVAWGLFDDNVLGLSSEFDAEEVKASAIVLATGSSDIALPFPGWTLPGVMTSRAAQIFMHIHRVRPGDRWAILGGGNDADELAHCLEQAGAEIVTRCTDVERLRASGVNRLSHVEVDDIVHEVDSLAIALGRQPDAELAFQAKAAGAYVPDLGGYTVSRDNNGETTEQGVFVAGDAAGIATLDELVAEGRLVGLVAAGAPKDQVDEARTALKSVETERRAMAINQLRPESTRA